MEWSRIQNGTIKFNPENINLIAEINNVLLLLNDSAMQKSILISKRPPHDLHIIADKAMVKTILRNIISNAIKFTNPKGKIIICIKQKPKELVISVSDNGVEKKTKSR